MAQMDEFKEEREAIKTKPFKDKMEYIFDYYKWHIIGIIAIVCFTTNYIYTQVTAKEEVLHGLILNAVQYTSESYVDLTTLSNHFLKELSLDNNEYEIVFNTSVTYIPNSNLQNLYNNADGLSIIMSQIAGETVDFISADVDTMVILAYKDCFMDLSKILSEEDYEKYKPYFLYIDKAVLNDSETTFTEYPDCREPNTMEEPIPVLIDMSDSEIFLNIYGNPANTSIALGLPANLPHQKTLIEFIKFAIP